MRSLYNFARDYWRLMRGQHFVGEYRADYTPLTYEELHAPDPELDDLYKRSRPVKSEKVTASR
jgi:hypothetical protein